LPTPETDGEAFAASMNQAGKPNRINAGVTVEAFAIDIVCIE
jgi:hypothetical protein